MNKIAHQSIKVRRPYAFCCIEGGGRIDGCGCDKPDHGYAEVEVRAMLPGDKPMMGGGIPVHILARGHWHPGDEA